MIDRPDGVTIETLQKVLEDRNDTIAAMDKELFMFKQVIPTAVKDAIYGERVHQILKWGDKPQSLAGFIMILEAEIAEAKLGWMKNLPGRNSPLSEIVQVATVAIVCLQRYGVTGGTINVNDELEGSA